MIYSSLLNHLSRMTGDLPLPRRAAGPITRPFEGIDSAGLALVDRGRFDIAKIFDGQGATIVERATDGRDFYRPRYAGRRRARFKAVFQPADS